MIQKIFIATVTVLYLSKANAQTLNDPIYFNYTQLSKTNFDKKLGDVITNLFEVNATFPALKISRNIKIFNAVYYRKSNFEYGSLFTQKNSFPNTLHDIRYSAIIRVQLNTQWELVALPRIMVRSDLNQQSTKMIFFHK